MGRASTTAIRAILISVSLLAIHFAVTAGQAEEKKKPWVMPVAPEVSKALGAEKMKKLGAEVSRDLGKVKTLRCTFLQERHSELLLRPFRARGTFWHRSPTSLRWEITSPRKSVLLSDGKSAKRYKHFRGKWEEDKLVSAGGLLTALRNLSGWLAGKVPVEGTTAWKIDGGRTFVRLSPCTPELARYLVSIDLLLVEKPWRITAVQLREKSGDRVVIRMLEQESNASLPENIFTHVELP